MLRNPSAWVAPFALLAGFACANAQADEINIPSFNAQNIAAWDLSFRENYRAGEGPDRSRFPLHGPAVVGDWLRLNTSLARRQHAYATAPGTLDPNLPIQISYEFLSWTDAAEAPRMMGFQLFDANLANSLDHFDYCGSKSAQFRVMHGNFDGWGPECFDNAQMDREERIQIWGPGKSLLVNEPSPVKLACRDTQFVAIDKSWHCATREEAIGKGFVRRVEAWLTPEGDRTYMDVFIDGLPVGQAMVPTTTAERLRFGFLSKAESSAASHAEIRSVRVSQSMLFMAPQELTPEYNSQQCMRVMGAGSHWPITLGDCMADPREIFVRAEKMLKVGEYCLTVENNVNAEGAQIISHDCYNGKNQQWNVTRNGNIRSMMDGVPRCITSNGTQTMRLSACEEKTTQRFFPLMY